MNILVEIGGVNLTPFIDWGSYKMEHKDQYESWLDGNYTEHRVYTRTKIEGSFRVWLCGMRVLNTETRMDTDEFLDLWNRNTTNSKITTLAVYDQAENRLVVIEAYCEIIPEKHKQMINGNYYDTFTIKVRER